MSQTMWDVIVVGAGAAGLLAATRSAERGRRTLLVEKNPQPGVKILMSGGTRCNLTHATDSRGIIEAFGRPGRFLHSALAALSPPQLIALVESEGVSTKVEETGKVFPASNKAVDVLNAFLARLRRSGCTLAAREPLRRMGRESDAGFFLQTESRLLAARQVILATGGRSYPGCGTTGDGYTWCADLGHTIVPPRPALTPITTNAEWVRDLKGVTLPDVAVRVVQRDTPPTRRAGAGVLATRRGSFLFTHFGLSGPVVLDVSRAITGYAVPSQLDLQCDFLPTLSDEQLDRWLQEQAGSQGKRQLSGVLCERLPRRLAESLCQLAGLAADERLAEVSKNRRRELVQRIKAMRIPVSGTRGFGKAEVTAGGVSLDEIDSATMQSRIVPGLFVVGELLDLDGPIGGYNFQAAFSTAWLAGERV